MAIAQQQADKNLRNNAAANIPQQSWRGIVNFRGVVGLLRF